MYGLPASGKSHICESYREDGYVIISRDEEGGSTTGLLPLVHKELNKGLNVVVDGANYLTKIRKEFIDFAHSNGYTIGLHGITTNSDDCLINSLNRMFDKTGKVFMDINAVTEEAKKIPNIFVISGVFNIKKKAEPPTIQEDFDDMEYDHFERIDKYEYPNKALFIDLDGTVRTNKGSFAYPLKRSEVVLLPNIHQKLNLHKIAGYKIIAVSNQSGVGKGILTYESAKDCIEYTNELLGGVIDDYHFCHHSPPPKEMCYCRKPQSGMGIYFMHKYQLDLIQCIMVGDRTEDKTFAKRLGMKYYHPDEFFKQE